MLVKAVELASMRTRRAGIIPYTYHKGKIYYMFGTDAKYGDLTDFGGQRDKYESAFATAMREFGEETNHLFRDHVINIDKSIGIVDTKKMRISIMFVPVNRRWIKEANPSFESRKSIAPNEFHKEIGSIVWLSSEQLQSSLESKGPNKIWSKVRKFMSEEFVDFEKKLVSLMSE